MIRASVFIAATLVLVAAGGAYAQEEPKPAAGASAQGAVQGQWSVSAGSQGATANSGAAGSADATAAGSSATVGQGTEINATLTRSVDAGRAKPGDQVTARAANDIRSGGEVIIPRGSKLLGHITQAESRSGGSARADSASRLGIVFDRAVLKDGRTVALNGAITAIGAAHAAGSTGSSRMDPGASGAGGMTSAAGGLAGTVGSSVGGVAGATAAATGNLGAGGSAVARSAGAVGGLDATGGLRSGSRGVFGMRDLEIASAAEGAAAGSVISSTKRNVRLEGGTQMLIVAGARAADQSADSAGSSAPADQPGREAMDDKR